MTTTQTGIASQRCAWRPLHKRGIPATIYECEPIFTSRGYLAGSPDLRYDTRQRGLRESGLEQQLRQHSRPESDCSWHCDSQRVLGTSTADPNGKPRTLRLQVDRSALRKTMLDALPPDTVNWGRALSSVRPLGTGEHDITLANGHTAVSDVLVGADDAHSRAQPIYHPAMSRAP